MSNAHTDVQQVENSKRGTWVRVGSRGTMYLGRVHLLDGKNPYGQFSSLDPQPREEVPVDEVLKALVITLMPAYDFMVDMQRVPIRDDQGKVLMDGPMPITGLARRPVTAGLDFLLYDTPIHLRTFDNIYFFSQMHSADRAVYTTFVDEAEKRNLQIRAEQSGLTLATGPVGRGPRR